MQSELWFPSTIWNTTLTNIDNTAIANFAQELRATTSGTTISNYGGWHSLNLTAGMCNELDELVRTIESNVLECAKEVNIGPVELSNVWININPPGSYNTLHHHLGSLFSGAYYIDANPSQGNIQFERNDGAEYHLPLDLENKNHYTNTRATYPAETGKLYVFPGWLKHSVQGNMTEHDRISLSFNYGVK